MLAKNGSCTDCTDTKECPSCTMSALRYFGESGCASFIFIYVNGTITCCVWSMNIGVFKSVSTRKEKKSTQKEVYVLKAQTML